MRTRTQSFFRESLCYNEIDFTIGPVGRAEDIASLMRHRINSDAIRFSK